MFNYAEVAKLCGVTRDAVEHDIRFIRGGGFEDFAKGGFEVGELGYYVVYLDAKKHNGRRAGIEAIYNVVENEKEEKRSYSVEKRIVTALVATRNNVRER